MSAILFIALVTVPIVEIAIFLEVGGIIGFWPTMGVVVLTAFIGTGLLRQRTPQWLSAPRLRAKVLAISQARIEHGGAGAYYVLLKRRRS